MCVKSEYLHCKALHKNLVESTKVFSLTLCKYVGNFKFIQLIMSSFNCQTPFGVVLICLSVFQLEMMS